MKPGVTAADFDFEAPHHGLALTDDGRTLCLAGRASDYAALVRAPELTLIATIPVGDAPGWAETADAGRLCLIANTRSDDLSIISIADRKEILRLPVGDGPKAHYGRANSRGGRGGGEDTPVTSPPAMAGVPAHAITVVFDGIDNQLLGVVIPTVMNEWEVAASAFAPVVSLGYAGMMVGGALAGIAGDRFGRRQALLGSVAVFGAMTLATAAVHDLTTLAALRFLAGIGLGGALPNAATLAAEFVPPAQRPMAVTATIVCVPLGGMLAGILGSQFLDDDRLARPLHRRWRRPSHRRRSADAPVAGIPAFLARHPAMAGARAARREARPAGAARRGVRGFAERNVTRAPISSLFDAEFRRDTIALWFSFCSCLLAVYLGFSWLPTVLAGAGFGPSVASSGITAFNLGGVVGALASGAVMSRIGSRAAMLTMTSAPSPAR